MSSFPSMIQIGFVTWSSSQSVWTQMCLKSVVDTCLRCASEARQLSGPTSRVQLCTPTFCSLALVWQSCPDPCRVLASSGRLLTGSKPLQSYPCFSDLKPLWSGLPLSLGLAGSGPHFSLRFTPGHDFVWLESHLTEQVNTRFRAVHLDFRWSRRALWV